MTTLKHSLYCVRVALWAAALMWSGHASAAGALIPQPASVQSVSGSLRITGPFAISVQGCDDRLVPAAIARFQRDFKALVGVAQPGSTQPASIRCETRDPHTLTLEAKEQYRLAVSATGVTIDAAGETGVVRALATLRQLIGRDAAGPMLPLVNIVDQPRFAWRGLMIDTARHFMSVATLKRQIDAMELAKLNVLHLHLSDNEAFRVESRRFSRLTQNAAPGETYSQDDIRELVRYAGERAVRIVPEFDMPGHNLALLKVYPELGVAPIDARDPLLAAKGALNPASEATYEFLEAFFAEMAPLFPDAYFHIGGDEVSDAAWEGSAEVEALKRKHGLRSKIAVEDWFHQRVRKLLSAYGRTIVGWDEIAASPLPKEVIVQAWRTSNPIAYATAKGNRVVVSAGYYLTQLRPVEQLYLIDPLDPNAFATMTAAELAMVRRNPATAALVSDGLAPTSQRPLTAKQSALIIGGEAAVWTETVTDEMLDGILWPRALALAERFWSPASVRDVEDVYARIIPAMDQLRALGLQDEQMRNRMVARIAPDAPEVVKTLLDVTAPTRNFSRAKAGHYDPIQLADVASADPSAARRFRNEVTAYLRGDRTRVPLLRAQLSMWRDNTAAFEVVAAGRPFLEAAIPTARDVGNLGVIGLAALDALEGTVKMPDRLLQDARALLTRLKDFEDASKDIISTATKQAPPAELIVLTAADVARLVDASVRE